MACVPPKSRSILASPWRNDNRKCNSFQYWPIAVGHHLFIGRNEIPSLVFEAKNLHVWDSVFRHGFLLYNVCAHQSIFIVASQRKNKHIHTHTHIYTHYGNRFSTWPSPWKGKNPRRPTLFFGVGFFFYLYFACVACKSRSRLQIRAEFVGRKIFLSVFTFLPNVQDFFIFAVWCWWWWWYRDSRWDFLWLASPCAHHSGKSQNTRRRNSKREGKQKYLEKWKDTTSRVATPADRAGFQFKNPQGSPAASVLSGGNSVSPSQTRKNPMSIHRGERSLRNERKVEIGGEVRQIWNRWILFIMFFPLGR